MRLVIAALAAAACALTAAADVHVGPTGMQGPIGKPQTTNVQFFFPSFLTHYFFSQLKNYTQPYACFLPFGVWLCMSQALNTSSSSSTIYFHAARSAMSPKDCIARHAASRPSTFQPAFKNKHSLFFFPLFPFLKNIQVRLAKEVSAATRVPTV